MTTRIIALIALLALLATPPRTTGRTRRFNSIANKSFCSSQTRESESPLSLPLSLSPSHALSVSLTTQKILHTQKISKIHTFWFSRKHVQTTMRCVSLSLPLFSLSAVALDVHFIALERLSYSRFYRSRGIARGGVCLRAFSFSFFFFSVAFCARGGVAVPKFLTSSRSLFHHHAVKSSTYKPGSAVTKSGQSSGRCARGFFPFFRSL